MSYKQKRKPFEGIRKVVAFNWPMYLWTSAFIICSAVLVCFTSGWSRLIIGLACGGTLMQLLASLIAVQWAYDSSDLFRWHWLENALDSAPLHPTYIATINAGFDEFTEHIRMLFKDSDVQALDFYNPDSTTEPSIARARRLYPSPVPAITIDSGRWDVETRYQLIFIMFSAHEIRTQPGRIAFFEQVRLHLAPKTVSGKSRVILVEHLRNLPNFIVFNIGTFHFYPFSIWKDAWRRAGLRLVKSLSISPFVNVMILEVDDDG